MTLSDEWKNDILNPNDKEKRNLIIIGVYFLIILMFWNLKYVKNILYPFKLITVAFHELGHALVGVLTGAKVESIELDPELGGKTLMRGGSSYCTLPAGYLGSSIIGSAMVFCGFNTTATKVVSVIVGVFLLMVLYWANNNVARGITFLFIAAIAVAFFVFDGIALPYFIFFLGMMSALYSVWDILEDLVFRKVNESDASQFAKRYGCCPAQFWGIFWFLISCIFLIGAILLAIIAFHGD